MIGAERGAGAVHVVQNASGMGVDKPLKTEKTVSKMRKI
jgi:hypothetical protein